MRLLPFAKHPESRIGKPPAWTLLQAGDEAIVIMGKHGAPVAFGFYQDWRDFVWGQAAQRDRLRPVKSFNVLPCDCEPRDDPPEAA